MRLTLKALMGWKMWLDWISVRFFCFFLEGKRNFFWSRRTFVVFKEKFHNHSIYCHGNVCVFILFLKDHFGHKTCANQRMWETPLFICQKYLKKKISQMAIDQSAIEYTLNENSWNGWIITFDMNCNKFD